MVGKVVKVSGPLIVASGMADSKMYDVVRIGEHRLIGEIIELRGEMASIQVYEETAGLGPGEDVESTGDPLSVELAPGLIESIFDGIQRPLDVIRRQSGDRIQLNREKKWAFLPRAQVGDALIPGDVLGVVQETALVEHRIMVPAGISGTLDWIFEGEATIEEPIARVDTGEGGVKEIAMLRRWPVRRQRPDRASVSPA